MNFVLASDWFFDDPKVIARVERARLRAMSRFGAFVRTSARSSLRRRKKPSKPGQPPSVHSRDKYATLKNILFAYDSATDSVVVGPVLLADSKRRNAKFTVPELHEKSGTRQTLSGKLQRYPARPFMLPALEKQAPNFADQFTGTVGE